MSSIKIKQINDCHKKTYARTELQLTHGDKAIIKEYCDSMNIPFNRYVVEVIKEDLAKKGIYIQGGARVAPDDVKKLQQDDR